MIKKLVVVSFTLDSDENGPIKDGRKQVYFRDPETMRLYEPNDDFEVTGENLEELFHSIEITR